MSTYDVISPVDETVVETVPSAGAAEIDERVERAHRAFAAWRQVAPGDRARLLRRFAEAVDADIDTLAAQVPTDAPHLLAFYQSYFRPQGTFPVYERPLS